MSKRQRLEEDEDDDTKSLVEPTSSIICSIQPCENTPFLNYSSYESHVLTNHTHNCLQCKKRFPNENLLEIHIEENHNPFFDIKKDKGEKVYRCFETGCSKVSADRRKRRLHMIDKHGYPRNYRFNIIYTGIGQFNSLLK